MKANLSTRDYEQISAYLDGQLSTGERNRLEARLRTQPDLQVALDEMSRTRALLRQAPKRRAPRNFTLTPEMVSGISPRRRSMGLFNGSLFPALSFTSALATLALMISLAARLLPGPAMSTMASPLSSAPLSSAPMVSAPQSSMEGATLAANSLMQKSGGENEFLPENPAAGAPAPDGSTGAADNSTAAKAGEANGNGQSASASDAGALLGPQVPADASRGMEAGGFGGMGGGGPQGGGGQQGGQIVVPQEGIASLDPDVAASGDAASGDEASGDTAPGAGEPTAEPTANPATRNVQITGSGPILGVPQADTAGQVIEQRSVNGQSASPASDPSTDGTITAEPAEPDASVQDETSEPIPAEPAESAQRSLFGLPMLAVTQILLGAIALVTGAAAWIIYRKTRG